MPKPTGSAGLKPARKPKRVQGPGRRAGQDPAAVRHALLDAARRLFASRGFAIVSLRELAAAAGVTPAMVHYHFGDKDGLYEAVLAETIGPAMGRLAAYAESAAGKPDLHGLVRMYLATLAANPWLPQLILREVFADGGRLRERFIQGFASRGSRLLMDLMRHEQRAGRLRTDLDPAHTAMSLLSMCLFPFIAHGVTREVFGFRTDDASLDAYAAHVVRLFLHGTRHEGVSA